MQNKMLQAKRRQFFVLKPVDGYRIGRKVNRVRKCLNFWRVNVLSSEINDLEGVGSERLVLWKMTTKDMEELRQQIKQEALHKKRENIMPLTMQMSKDQIEKAYHSITEQWNVVDGIGERPLSYVCDDEECLDQCSDLEEENNNVEDADERNLTRLGSDNGSACGILENCDLESVDVVRTDLDDPPTEDDIRFAELSHDRDYAVDQKSLSLEGMEEFMSTSGVGPVCTAELARDRDESVNQKSLLSLENLEEFQTHCDMSSSKELSSVDPVCIDDSVSVQVEQEHLQSELEPCGIENSENDKQRDEICSDSVDEVIKPSVADTMDQIMDSPANGSGNYNASLCQAVDLIPEQKRVKLDENNACSEENKTSDLIVTSSVIEVQLKSAEIAAREKQSVDAESKCGDTYLKQISDHGNCDRVESLGDLGSGEPLKRVSVDLCRKEINEQSCCNKRPRRGKTVVNRCSLRLKLPAVGNHGQNVTFFQGRAKEFATTELNDCESLLLIVNQAESNRKISNLKADLKINDSYAEICNKRGLRTQNCKDDCQSGNFCENSGPAENEHMISDAKTILDNIVDAVSLQDAAALEVHNGNNSCAESLSNDGLSKSIDAEKNDSKPISKPGNCQTIKLCEVDLFCREKRKLSSSGSSKSEDFKPQLNCERTQQNKKIRTDRVKPFKKSSKKSIGQKGIITATNLVQSRTKDISRSIKKSVVDTNKRSEETKKLLSTLESTVCPVGKVVSTEVPTDDSKHHDGIANFQCSGPQNSVMESDLRLEHERGLADISSKHASKPETCLPSDEGDEHLASMIEFDMNFTQLSVFKSEKNLCIENRQSLKISSCKVNQDAVVDESFLDDPGIQMERLEFSSHLHTECSNDTVLGTNVEDISDILSLIDSQHYNSNTSSNTVAVPAKDYDDDDFGCLQMVPCTNSTDSVELVNHMYDAHVKDRLSQKETSPAHLAFETSHAPEELSSQNFVNSGEPCQSCRVDDACDLENGVLRDLDDSCKSDSCCGALKACVLSVRKETSVDLNSNGDFDSRSPGCSDLPAVAEDVEKMFSVDMISPIHSPSPCHLSSFLQNDSGIHEVENSDPQQQSPVIIPLTVGDQVTRDLLDCLRTTKIRLLSESDEVFENS